MCKVILLSQLPHVNKVGGWILCFLPQFKNIHQSLDFVSVFYDG